MSLPPISDSDQPDNKGRTPRDHRDPHRDRRQHYRGPGPVPGAAHREHRPAHGGDTAHPPGRTHRRSGDHAGRWEISDLVAAGVLDAVPGDPPVPVSVWRATGPDDPPVAPETIFAGLTTRLARMILAIWTDPGQIVIDTTADPAVRAATESGGRTYLPLTLPPSPLHDADLAGQAALILLRWPPPAPQPGTGPVPAPVGTADQRSTPPPSDEDTPHDAPDLILQSCRDLLAPDGHTVVILAPPTGRHYRDYARDVIPAARAAGLGYLQHLVVITSDAQPTAPGTDWLAHPRAHVDLLVFVLRAAAHPSGPS